MNFSDEQLQAYVDGELPDAQEAVLVQAMAHDATLAQRVARQQALRERLRGTFDAVLQEPVPERLIAFVKQTTFNAVGPVADLSAARHKGRRRAGSVLPLKSSWFAIAASILVGAIAALLTARWNAAADLALFKDGQLVAHGALARALDEQLASATPPNPAVHIGLSFKAKSGRYCRTFDIAGAEGAAGLACYEQQHWRVLTLIGKPAKEGAEAVYRMAGSDLSPLLLQSVGENITGEPLDAPAEMRARSAGWH